MKKIRRNRESGWRGKGRGRDGPEMLLLLPVVAESTAETIT